MLHVAIHCNNGIGISLINASLKCILMTKISGECNEKNIAFCGGDAANPGLVFPESTGVIDFKNADVILGCMNCSDDKFLSSTIMYADQAMEEARVLFVLTISLYPIVTGVFE